MSTEDQTVKNRDAGTRVLRKLGIKPRDYDLFLTTLPDDTMVCHVDRAKLHLHGLQQSAAAPQAPVTSDAGFEFDDGDAPDIRVKAVSETKFAAKKPRTRKSGPVTTVKVMTKKSTKKVSTKKTPKKKAGIKKGQTIKRGEAPSVASVMKEMILAGKTNDQIWARCQPMFNLDEKKKGYPGWYRAEMRRQGTKV